MFHDPRGFPFTAALESHWEAVRREFLGVRDDLHDWFERKLYDRGWKVLGLYDFPHGQPIPGNVSRCPVTAGLIEEHVPGHGAVGFSVLEPRTHVRPHVGYDGPYLRAHLGLVVPEGDCRLTVGGESRPWREGEVLVFDDRVRHEAWNRSAGERVVLLIDFREDLARPARR